jgi:autotransporter-associated beta strand protein
MATGTNAGTYTSNLQVSGAALDNYNTPTITNANLVVAPATIVITGANNNVTYNGYAQTNTGATASINGATAGAISGSTISTGIGSQSFTFDGYGSGTNARATAYADNLTLTAGVGTSAGNYSISITNGGLTIAKANAYVVITSGQSSGYGVTPVITYTYYSTSSGTGGVVISDPIGLSGAAVITNAPTSISNAATYSLVYASGLSSTNYTFGAVNGSVNYVVNPAVLNLTISKTYNGNTTFTHTNTYEISGARYNGDLIPTIASGSATTNSANAGSYSSFVSSNLVLSNPNYTLVGGVVNAMINKATLVLTGSRNYDGTSSISAANLVINGVNSETFSVAGSADLSAKNVQVNQPLLSVSGLSLSPNGSALLSNYLSLSTADSSVTINSLPVTLTAPTINKVYDGGYTYSMTAADLMVMSNQLVGGDRVTAADVFFTSNDPSVGINKSVTLNSVFIDDGNNGANYSVTKSPSTTSQISPAQLIVTANNSSKFVTQVDPTGYSGVSYSGWVNGESTSVLGGSISYSRANASVNTAGVYDLSISGLTANNGNYSIQYVPGAFTIVPADQLLVQISPAVTNYGTAPTYTATAKYLTCSVAGCPSSGSVNVIHTLSPIINGNIFYAADGAGGAAAFTITPVGGTLSSSGNLNVGSYQLSTEGVAVTSNNFSNTIALTGSVTVAPLSISVSQLGISGVSKVYNGSNSISGLILTTNAGSSVIVSGDAVTVLGTGTYVDANVGLNKSVTLLVGLTGADAGNYFLSSSQMTSNIGTISQLPSVTYIGNSGGSWSNASNWENGAVPLSDNVAQVIIPIDKTVIYDATQVGRIGSSIINNGVLSFTSPTNFNFTNTTSGIGSISHSGAGALVISGDNLFTGLININASTLYIGSPNALGASGTVISNGGSLGLLDGVTIPSINITGSLAGAVGSVNLISDIRTTSNQTYNANVTINPTAITVANIDTAGLISSSITPSVTSSPTGTTVNLMNGGLPVLSPLTVGNTTYQVVTPLNIQPTASLISQGGIIQLLGTVNGFNDAALNVNGLTVIQGQSLSITAGNAGSVILGDSIGLQAKLYDLKVSAGRITLLADVLTLHSQVYDGPSYIGDASYLNKPTALGGLLTNSYQTYFNTTIGGITTVVQASTPDKRYVRTLISLDPFIQFTSSIDDTVIGTHTLLLGSFAQNTVSANMGLLDPPVVIAGTSIGLTVPLYSLSVQALVLSAPIANNGEPLNRGVTSAPNYSLINTYADSYIGGVGNSGSIFTSLLTGQEVNVGASSFVMSKIPSIVAQADNPISITSNGNALLSSINKGGDRIAVTIQNVAQQMALEASMGGSFDYSESSVSVSTPYQPQVSGKNRASTLGRISDGLYCVSAGDGSGDTCADD